jgi:hypothetical protein
MKLKTIIAAAIVLLAGCAEAADDETVDAALASPDLIIFGVITDPSLQPLAGVNVTIVERNLTEFSKIDGSFRFPAIPQGIYTLHANGANLIAREVAIRPGLNESITLALETSAEEARIDTAHYRGHMQCGAEYIIIAGACDRPSTEFGGPEAIDQESVFTHPVDTAWTAIVVDVVFEVQPTFDGIRVTTRGTDDSDALNEYDEYAKSHGSESFTFRIEPGQTYEGGAREVPANATQFVLDVFAQGYEWHTVCDPTDSTNCFLGAGAGIDIKFDIYVSTFYIDPAPAGYTLQ